MAGGAGAMRRAELEDRTPSASGRTAELMIRNSVFPPRRVYCI